MEDRKHKLQRIIQIGIEVAQIKDLDVLLEKVLSEARLLVNADAGSIYIKEDETLKFSYAQNETLRKRLPEGKKLIYTTFSMPITNKSIAGFVAGQSAVLNIKDAYKIGNDKPYSFDSSYDKISGYEDNDGKPRPKKGEEIPLYGRIVALADVYDALSSKRSYKEAWDEKKVLTIIKEERGLHFDPEVVDSFFEVLDVIRSISQRYPDQGIH